MNVRVRLHGRESEIDIVFQMNSWRIQVDVCIDQQQRAMKKWILVSVNEAKKIT